MKKQLAIILLTVTVSGVGAGYLIQRYIGKHAGVAIGGSLFLAGVTLQVVQVTKKGGSNAS